MAKSLGPEHYEMLRQAQQDLHDVITEIDKAEAAGVDVGEIRSGHAYLADRINRLIAVYFPVAGSPPHGGGLPRSS